jgi:hypothetical protein
MHVTYPNSGLHIFEVSAAKVEEAGARRLEIRPEMVCAMIEAAAIQLCDIAENDFGYRPTARRAAQVVWETMNEVVRELPQSGHKLRAEIASYF